MYVDSFSKFHPLVNFIFFAFVIAAGVLLQHPLYILCSFVASGIYFIMLYKEKCKRTLFWIMVLFVFLSLVNPLVNTRGNTLLFTYFNRQYTLEALLYGMVIAGTFCTTLFWCGCMSKIFTGDKFYCLFGDIIPTLTLLLVMIFRMVPELIRKAKQIGDARKALGRHGDRKLKEKFCFGMEVLGSLTAYALEGSIVTGDSMRARGYASTKRKSFVPCTFTFYDALLSLFMIFAVIIITVFMTTGSIKASFIPYISVSALKGRNIIPFIAYLLVLYIPILLNLKERLQWSISRSKI